MGSNLIEILSSLTFNDARIECQRLASLIETENIALVEDDRINEVFIKIVENRICNRSFVASRPAKKWISLIFRVLRTLLRDKNRVKMFHSIELHSNFVEMFQFIAFRFVRNELEWTNIIVNCLNVTQKLIENGENAQKFVDNHLEEAVLLLLFTRQMTVLQHSLEILGRLSDWTVGCRENLCESNTIDICLQLIPDGDILTQKLCVSLLRILSCEEQAREQIRIYDGVPTLLGLLSIKNSRLQWHVAWTLAQLAEQIETSIEIAQLGGISLILAEISNPKIPDRAVNDYIAMLTGLTALLAQLCQCSSNQQVITNSNGVFIIGKMLSLRKTLSNTSDEISESCRLLQCSIFRVLRLLFPYDRARQMMKKVFETNIFEKFVDIGNYVHALSEYDEVTAMYDEYISADPGNSKLWENINERRHAMGEVGEFELLDQLGAGAFGCVYTVRKKTQNHAEMPAKLFALKEIFMTNLSDRESDKSFGDMINEVKIIKQQLRHPNIVRYRRIFVENHRLYIVMDLIQGSSLKEHITTMKDKKSSFEESKIWNMVVQMLLALRYLHKEKRIVHRDLKPNNIMITDNDRIVITDFGLAKQKGVEYLKSAAGTILYSCPEIVQNLPYGEKADIWSFGCCVYEMCQLKSTFHSANMLTLAIQIVEAKYEPLDNKWSHELSSLITTCLTSDAQLRPDVLQLSNSIGSRILEYLDDVARQQATMLDNSCSSNVSIHESTSLNSSTNSFKRTSRTSKVGSGTFTILPPIDPTIPRRNHSLSASDTFRSSSSSSILLPRISVNASTKIAQNRRRVQTCSTDHPTRSNSSNDIKNASGNGKTDGVSVRSNALRQIQDPVLTILAQIHRILLVTDKEGSSTIMNHQRRLVEMFRKQILGRHSNAELMKMHLRKLAAESTDEIEMNLGFSDFRPVLIPTHLSGYQTNQKVTKITYEQLAGCIQNLMSDNNPIV